LYILKLQALHGIAETIKRICFPFKVFKVNTDEIKVMICISLSMIPILKKDLYDIKEACIAKNINFNLRNMKTILTKFFLTLFSRVNEIEESLEAKGYSNE
jgi:energy-coupling factor transporter transmembrane protein EcfT